MTSDDQTRVLAAVRNNHYRLDLMDCVELLLELPPGSADLIFADHAYAALEKHRVTATGKRRGTTTRLSQSDASSNDWFPIFPDARYPEFFAACHRAQSKDAHLYMMCAVDWDQADVMIRAARGAGYRFWKPITWDKVRMGMGYHWRAQSEWVLFFEKGKRKLNHLGWPDVLSEGAVHDEALVWTQACEAAMDAYEAGKGPPCEELSMFAALEAYEQVVSRVDSTIIQERKVDRGSPYPTEKPWKLIERFVRNSSLPGELVVDPCMGSGSTGEAALRSGRRFAGGDVSPRSIEVASERLGKLL